MSVSISRIAPGNVRVILPVLLVVAVGLAAGAWYLAPRFEREPPQISLGSDTDVLGPAPMEILVSDSGAGLASVTATLSSGSSQHTLAAEQYERPTGQKKITVALSPLPAGIKEGSAVIRVHARDRSLWNLFRGNERVFEKTVTIDLTPPTLELIADDRYVNFGGVGVIVYDTSADTATSGVRIGERFFPGYAGQIKDHPARFVAFFAHAYDAPPDARASLLATDKAGNTREMRLSYELKEVRYRKSTIAVPESFIQNKVAPLLADAAARQGSLVDVFVRVNKALRKENEDRITAITSKASPAILWQGAFKQLSNSKVEANFADARTYTFNGETIDHAHHLGFDLSVTRRYPVEAANSGVVAFAGDLGIYGNTVILDHGLGLHTLYAHLSSIDVKPDERVKREQIIGRTGETGLAAGDHLHYGVYLNGVAVLPIEWWDAKWIEDNIQPKLAGQTGEAIARAQEAKPARASQRRKRR